MLGMASPCQRLYDDIVIIIHGMVKNLSQMANESIIGMTW